LVDYVLYFVAPVLQIRSI